MLKMKPWKWVVLAIFTYLILLVAYIPAAHVLAFVQKNNPKLPVSIGSVEGTLWSGRVDKVIAQGIAINNLRWELSPWSLLLGKASIDLNGGKIRDTQQTYVKGNISASLFNVQNISAQELKLFLPARSVMAQVPMPVPVTADGRFRVDIQDFEFNNACINLAGKGSWLKGTVSGPTGVIDFGNFDANLACEGEQFSIQILPDNKLNLDAKVLLSVAGKYKINGRFKPASDLPKEVHQSANFFGAADSQGYRNINL
ncbi:type II secretion system protein N [Glaciecola sp. MF2-115]|uniref:type II secretion system protein N n=1 Tax=Glaciecola sp. MF2-115 TaxID=3384827 RepID=UPI0039A00E09